MEFVMKPVPEIQASMESVPAATLDGEIEISDGTGLTAGTVKVTPMELC